MSLRSFLDGYEQHPAPKKKASELDQVKQENAVLKSRLEQLQEQLITARERINELEVQLFGGGK